MRVCFVVTPAEWEQAQKTGRFSANPKATARSVEWLRKQMAARLPNYSGQGPMTAWPHIPRNERDLHGDAGSEMVYVEAEIPETRCLPYHFITWELTVQLEQYLTTPDPEDMAVEARGATDEEMELSWERVFEVERMKELLPDETVQLAVDVIYMAEVVKSENYIIHPTNLNWAAFQQDVAMPLDDPRLNSELQSLMYPSRCN